MAIPASLEIRKLTYDSGEIGSYLVADGFPLVLPNLWAEDLRLSLRANTVEAYLRDILLLYRTAEVEGIVPEAKLRSLMGFSRLEIKHLAKRLCETREGEAASKSTCSRRFESVRSFLTFSFDYFKEVQKLTLSDYSQADKNRDSQLSKFRKQMYKAANKGAAPAAATDLTRAEMAVVDAVMHPASELNPFKKPHVRVRNYCLFHVMWATAPRRAEVVLLELEDVRLGGAPTIVFKSPSVAAKGRRRDGASLKTRGREVPIDRELAHLLAVYREECRSYFVNSRIPSKAFFLSSRDGRRLSSYAINQIFDTVERVPEVASLGKRIHPHGLRTTSANSFRRKICDAGRASGIDLAEAMAYIGGWVQGSPMVAHYTRSEISARLAAIVRGSGA